MKQSEKAFHLLRIRILVGTVYKRHIVSAALFCHCLVCHEHEILNDPGCHICLVRLDVNGTACCIENDLAFREIKINGTSVVTVSPQDLGKLLHQEKHGNQICIPFLCFFVCIFQNIFHICIIHSFIHTDHRLCDLVGNHIAFFINVHQAA